MLPSGDRWHVLQLWDLAKHILLHSFNKLILRSSTCLPLLSRHWDFISKNKRQYSFPHGTNVLVERDKTVNTLYIIHVQGLKTCFMDFVWLASCIMLGCCCWLNPTPVISSGQEEEVPRGFKFLRCVS